MAAGDLDRSRAAINSESRTCVVNWPALQKDREMLLSFPRRDVFNEAVGEVVLGCFTVAFAGETPDADLGRALPDLAASVRLSPPVARDALARVEAARGWLEEARVSAAAECLGAPYDDIVAPWAVTRAVELAFVIGDLDESSRALRQAARADLAENDDIE